MNTEPHPDNHYHLDDEPRYELTGDEGDPDQLAQDPDLPAPSEIF